MAAARIMAVQRRTTNINFAKEERGRERERESVHRFSHQFYAAQLLFISHSKLHCSENLSNKFLICLNFRHHFEILEFTAAAQRAPAIDLYMFIESANIVLKLLLLGCTQHIAVI